MSGPSDPQRRFVRLAGGSAAYTDEGEGPVVLAVHGLPGSGRDFRWLAPQLSGFARVIRVDLPGFGETPVATGADFSLRGRARFVVELARALELTRPVLLGHSMGGVVACAAAELAPDLFRGLALLSSPGLRPHAMLRYMPFRMLSGVLSLPLLARVLQPAVRLVFTLSGFRGYPDAALVRTLHCVAETSIEDHADTVRRLSLPTLVAWCEDDPMISSDIAEELAAACPVGPRLWFVEGGHNPQKSCAREIGESMASWLAELFPAPAIRRLLAQLDSPATAERRRAENALREILYPRYRPPGVTGPYAMTGTEANRIAEAHYSRLRGSPDVLPLVEALRHGGDAARRYAAGALGSIEEPRAIPGLIAALADDCPEVRAAAARGFWSFPQPDALDALVTALADPVAEVRRAAAFALGRLRAPEAAAPLEALLAAGDVEDRAGALHALGEIGDRASLPAVRKRLKDSSRRVRKAAKGALTAFDLRRRASERA